MPEQKLRIGKIPYANLFPIFYILENECDCSEYEFVEGVPSAVNRMLRMGEVDVSPSSSIEYLRHSDEYAIVENHSISSMGTVGSIILLSRKPIEELNGLPVLTSSQSETSVALLEIIFRKFYGIRCSLKSVDLGYQLSAASGGISYQLSEAYLLIGDDALKAVKSYELKVKSENRNSQLSTLNSQLMFIYDLGELWHKHTGLPFTFALWIYKKDCCKEKAELMKRFKNDLNKAKRLALENFKMIATESPLKGILTENELISYWNQISYDFGQEHKKGLELFRKYSEELGLI
ncbi:MAG: futalosine synthase [Nitrospirae bacterium CG_4_10_14_3_um_filter_44_29]|nr:MAG: futalosine synthase [Nitrospirae bacterium CG22_combo_CG10-13_8_21_14_all_44_11]PIV41669.1 MAG: futalosine synthase [Nitrospirae bacterium CG02_land_8_20_14_3_00_44_33]PIV66248.1 MAG: futalosine synthase [Nitrospirae bacterium CG01_land_8_20_14_3_00_44_22]PIX89544.1 MAG: futalosine synthase [Nitrospirae bacterium CG_4_10_14_3_um_filter_44_29]PJA83029.1 MAG: futalosine synthase [Nitrospirae bacterium CG_4_9_14_3_um_filter_44_28]